MFTQGVAWWGDGRQHGGGDWLYEAEAPWGRTVDLKGYSGVLALEGTNNIHFNKK